MTLVLCSSFILGTFGTIVLLYCQLHLFYSMLVSNDTLEELASHLFQRACVSMDELKHVDDMLTLGEFYLCTLLPLFTSVLCFLLSLLVSVY